MSLSEKWKQNNKYTWVNYQAKVEVDWDWIHTKKTQLTKPNQIKIQSFELNKNDQIPIWFSSLELSVCRMKI